MRGTRFFLHKGPRGQGSKGHEPLRQHCLALFWNFDVDIILLTKIELFHAFIFGETLKFDLESIQ